MNRNGSGSGRVRGALALGAALIVALGAAGCGSSDKDEKAAAPTTTATTAASSDGKLPEMTKATLVLDYIPNALHTGIFRAIAAGYYEQENIDLRVIQPTSSADTLRLIDAGKADFGLADGYDVANQIMTEDRELKSFLAITQSPLGGIITLAKDNIAGGKAFEGKTIGTTGVPSDNAILETIVKDGGGDPKKVKVVTVGFNGVQNLESGKLSGFIGFWPSDGVQVEQDGMPTKIFRLDENGGPAYPGIVAYTSEGRLNSDKPLMQAFSRATIKGYEDTIKDPASALDDLLKQNKSLKRDFSKASLDALLPVFQGDAPKFGVIRPEAITALSDWMVSSGLSDEPITYERYAAADVVPED